MASNSFGEVFRFTTFGESHGKGIGVIVDGVPAGISLNEEMVQVDLDKRKPGQSSVTTSRKESDSVSILSGVFEGVTTGHPIGMVIYNSDAKSSQYDNIKDLFRPGHADWSYFKKYGVRDYRGSGRASGRETATRVAAGAVAKAILSSLNISIVAGGIQVGDIKAEKFNKETVYANAVRSVDPDKAVAMEELIKSCAAEGDSIGGIVECRVAGLDAGWGEPTFDKLDAKLAYAMVGLGAVKGIEFGSGFEVAELKGSENNDPIDKNGFKSNNAGGVLGGISSGQELVFRIAVKPTSSIAKEQQTVTTEGEEVKFRVHGRHDPCLLPRIVHVVEAMTATVVADFYLRSKLSKFGDL